MISFFWEHLYITILIVAAVHAFLSLRKNKYLSFVIPISFITLFTYSMITSNRLFSHILQYLGIVFLCIVIFSVITFTIREDREKKQKEELNKMKIKDMKK